jgi:hypothetical protein
LSFDRAWHIRPYLHKRLIARGLVVVLAASTWTAGAQERASSSALPDDPEPQIKNAPNATHSEPDPKTASENAQVMQTKRILGIIPNFRSVSSTDVLPAQTPKEKFLGATDDSFDYSSIFIPAALAGYSLGTNAYPEFGTGAEAYGQYLWRSAVDQTIENYMVVSWCRSSRTRTRATTRWVTAASGSVRGTH